MIAPARDQALPASSPRLSQVYVWLVAVALAAVFVTTAIDLVQTKYDIISRDYSRTSVPLLPENDFTMFYAGSRLVLSSDRDQTYEHDRQVREILDVRGFDPPEVPPGETWINWLRYYNPPAFLIAASPLTLLEVRTAYLVSIAGNIALAAGLALAAGYVLRWRMPETALLALAIPAFEPTYFTIHHGQPTLFLALVLTLAFVASERGRTTLSAFLLTLAGVKPQFLVLPALAFLKEHRSMLKPLVAFGLVILALPFLVVGVEGTADYVAEVLGRGSEDLNDPGFSSALLNWSGFLRAWTGEAQAEAWLLLSLLSLALFGLTYARGDLRTNLAAGIVTTLLVVPHAHPQDWIVFVPVAALLLGREAPEWVRAGYIAVLVLVFFGVNDWVEAQRLVAGRDGLVYWAVPAAFLLQVWLAFTAWSEHRTRDTMAAGQPMTAPPSTV